MQCLNCGRVLSLPAGVNGVCPSCGFAISAPSPAAAGAPGPVLDTTPELGITQEQPVIAALAPEIVSPLMSPVDHTPSQVEAASAASNIPRAVVAPPPVVASEFVPVAPVAGVASPTSWQSPATPEPGNPLIPPVPPMMPPSQEYPVGYVPPSQAYPPQPPYPYATVPMPGYPPGAYPPTGAPPAGYPTGAYPPGMYPTLAPTAKKGANGLAIGLSVGVVVVIVAMLGSLIFLGRSGVGPLARIAHVTALPTATVLPTMTPSPTAIAVPPAPSGFSTFTANDGSYGLNYPTDWAQTSQTVSGITTELFSSPDRLSNFISVPLTGIVPLNQYQQFGQSFASNAKATNIHFSATPTSVTIGANSWNKETGTFTFQGMPYSCVLLGTNRWDGTFFAIYLAPKGGFSATDTANFTPMAQSITFMKP